MNKNGIEMMVAEISNCYHPLSEEDAKILCRLLMDEIMNPDSDPEYLRELDKQTHLRSMMEARIKACDVYQFTFSIRLSFFLVLMLGNPGSIVMALCAFQNYVFHNPNKIGAKLNLSDFAQVFPNGLPSEDEWHEIWTHQKVKPPFIGGSDNMVDYAYPYQSILSTDEIDVNAQLEVPFIMPIG